MKSILSGLSSILRSEYIQNADVVIGRKVLELYNCILSGQKPSGADFESVLFSLCSANNRNLSAVNAEIIGKIASIAFSAKKQKENSKLIDFLGSEILMNSLQAIIIFGRICKGNGLEISFQLKPHIQNLLKITNKQHIPFVFQCFRRIIKGTGIELKDECSEMFTAVMKGINSDDLNVQVECVKTLPCMLTKAEFSLKSLITYLEPYAATKSKFLRYHIAKSLSIMMYAAGSEKITNEYGVDVIDAKKMYKVAFNTILQFAQNYKNIPTMCHTMMMWVRNIKPTEITKRIHLFTKFAFAIVPFNVPIPYACTFTRTVLRAMTSVIGTTYEPLICHYVYEQARKEGFTTANTMITLDTLINLRSSAKTLTKAAKAFYPLLATEDTNLVRLVSSFFVVVGRREHKASQILVDSFVTWLTSDDVKPVEIYGFARGTAVLVMTANIREETINKINELCKLWLAENIENSDPRFAAALLLCAAVFKRSPSTFPMQLTLVAFRALPRLFRAGEKLSDANAFLALPMKFGSILMKQVILSNIETLPSLYPTIQQCSITIAHNSGYLSAPTLLSLWLSIRKCKPSWHISLPQTMMNATPTILARFFNPEENDNDYGMRKAFDEVDQAEILYGTNLPTQYATICTGKMETIYTLLVADVRTPMRDELVRIVLRDYCAWAVLSATPLKKSTFGQLYTPYQEEDHKLFLLRLTLIRAITAKPHVMQFIRSDCLRVLFSFATSDIRTTRVLGAAIASYVNLQDDKIEALLEYIESPKVNGPLVAAVISELKFPPTKKLEAVRCMLALERLMLSDQHPLEIFALTHLIEQNLIPDEFVDQTVTIIEQVAFSNGLWTAENMFYLSQCINLMINDYSSTRGTISEAYMNTPFNKAFGLLLALGIMEKPTKTLSLYDFSIERPIPILSSHIKFLDSMQEVPLILDIIQQGRSEIAEEKMKELFYENKNINFWIVLAKQILIKGWVPFVGCETKISPSVNVIHATMLIVDLTAQEIHKTFPENCEKLVDIITFPLAVLFQRDLSIHKCAFDMLTTFIEMFSDIKNAKGESVIKAFDESMHIAYNYVFDGSHNFTAGITFALTYYEYLFNIQDPFIEEATTTLLKSATEIQHIDPVNFIRITGRFMLIIGKPIKEIAPSYIQAVDNFISDVCTQKRQISELVNEAHTTLATFLKLKKEFPLEECFTMALAREMEISQFNESMLRLLTLLIMKRDHKVKEIIDFAVSVIASSKFYKYEMENYELLPNPQKQNSVLSFLAMSAAKIPPNATKWEDTFKNILSLSLAPRPAYKALALLIRCAPASSIIEIGPPIISFIMKKESRESEAIMELLFARMQVPVIDQIISSVIQFAIKPAIKFTVIKCALKHTKNTSLESLNSISQLTAYFMYPDGAYFLGYILGDEKTVVYGLNILRLGVADFLMTHEISEEHLQLTIDLLIIATQRMNVLFPTEFWPRQTTKLVFNLLMKSQSTDKETISHLFLLLKTIDPEQLSSIISENQEQLQLVFNHLMPN